MQPAGKKKERQSCDPSSGMRCWQPAQCWLVGRNSTREPDNGDEGRHQVSVEVNGQQFPAGTYFIQRDDMEPAVLLIRSANSKHEAFFTTNRDGGKDPVGETRPELQMGRASVSAGECLGVRRRRMDLAGQ